MKTLLTTLTSLSLCFFINPAVWAQEITTTVYTTDQNKPLGQVSFKDTEYGLLIIPLLNNLPSGAHGFHLHQNADCSEAGMAAGGHFDPQKTNQHKGPYANGHLGDLPVLFVMENGKASTPLLAPRLKTSDLKNLALMIHAGGDNYSDNPPLGGGGSRLGCGVIK
ncbi:superoxide dismutase family protein [Legionella quinlivanii]|nr:superoxide dismutase family protein [Legionella quinlivanii]MCW8451261.1 superoxide dismutase family protein [Legionella quinlivanii]